MPHPPPLETCCKACWDTPCNACWDSAPPLETSCNVCWDTHTPLETCCKACWDTSCNICWDTPPCEQNDKQVQKYYLGHNFVAVGKNWMIERKRNQKLLSTSTIQLYSRSVETNAKFFVDLYRHILPPINEVWGKVMFLHLLSVHGEGVYDVTSCLSAWSHVLSWGSLSGPIFIGGWGSLSGGRGSFVRIDPPYGERAGGTHPTIMLSYCDD